MKKEIVLFSNYVEDLMSEEEAREFLAENGEENITSNDIWEFIQNQSDFEWDEFTRYLDKYLEEDYYIATGTCGLWYGRVAGGKVLKNINDFYDLLKDCDYIKITDVGGHLMVQCSHHDGTNHYELRMLNDKGIEYYHKNDYNFDRKELCEKLFTSRYSKLPRLFERIYGC